MSAEEDLERLTAGLSDLGVYAPRRYTFDVVELALRAVAQGLDFERRWTELAIRTGEIAPPPEPT